jgi:hypothetical protein
LKPAEAVCQKALAAELGIDVARFLAGRRVTAHLENAWDLTRRPAVKYRTVLVLVLAYPLMVDVHGSAAQCVRWRTGAGSENDRPQWWTDSPGV